MVSGLVTSPCDQLRIFSGLASWILMASKSVIGPASSKGLERNIVCVSVMRPLAGCGCWLLLLFLLRRWRVVRPRLRLFCAPFRMALVHVEHWPHAEEVATGWSESRYSNSAHPVNLWKQAV